MASLLTPEELAAQYKISVKRIYALVQQKKLRAVRLPGSRLLRFDLGNLTVAEPTTATSSSVLRFTKPKKVA